MRSLSSSRWTDIVFTLAPVLLCYLLAKIADNNKGEPRTYCYRFPVCSFKKLQILIIFGSGSLNPCKQIVFKNFPIK